MHPPKKPANGGRIPVAEDVYEDMKEADLYGYTFDPKKPPGGQDPFAQRIGAEKSGGRELRQRRARDALDSAAPSEEEEEEDDEGRGVGRRKRRATRRFDLEEAAGTITPKRKVSASMRNPLLKHQSPTAVVGSARKLGLTIFFTIAFKRCEKSLSEQSRVQAMKDR
jgi:TATA-binding protein-associated factor Taf7